MTVDTAARNALLKMAADLGRICALDDSGLLKTSGFLGNILERSTVSLLPAGLGYVAAGPEHRLEGAVAGALGGRLGRRFLRGSNIKALRKAVRTEPVLAKHRDLADRELLSALRASKMVKESPGLTHIREFLPAMGKYEGVGSLAGGTLAGFGTGQILGLQDKPPRFIL